MRKLVLIAALMTLTGALTNPRAQRNDDPVTVQVCHITMKIPSNLKRNRREGVDSCIAEFESRDMLLSIDYGWYGGTATESDDRMGFKERSFPVGGRTGTLATYVNNSLYARKHSKRKYVAHLYVVVRQATTEPPTTTSLMMTVSGRSAKELAIADRIFRSIRFEQ